MMSDLLIYNIDYFNNKSSNLNRSLYKLSGEHQRKFNDIKFRLGIKDSATFKRQTVNKINKQKEELCEIYNILNKITTQTYEKFSNSIINYIECIDNTDIHGEICKKIFEIISSNSFYSELYAKLYNSMMLKNESFKILFDNHTNKYIKSFTELEYVSPSENYDKYCDYVKSVEKIESFTKFMIHCTKYDICSPDNIIDLAINFQVCLIDNLNNKDKLIENECYVNNIYIIIKEYGDLLEFNNKWDIVCRNIKYLMDNKGDGKNNKIRFKLMDINDIIKQ